MSKEAYGLTWLQDPSSRANSQDVVAVIDGKEILLDANIPMTRSSIEYDFPTDSVIAKWKVITFAAVTTEKVESPEFEGFVARNAEPLQGASNGSVAWVRHIP